MLTLWPPVQVCKAKGSLVRWVRSWLNQEPRVQLAGCPEGRVKSPEHLQGPRWGLTAGGAAGATGLAGRRSAAIWVLSVVIYLALAFFPFSRRIGPPVATCACRPRAPR